MWTALKKTSPMNHSAIFPFELRLVFLLQLCKCDATQLQPRIEQVQNRLNSTVCFCIECVCFLLWFHTFLQSELTVGISSPVRCVTYSLMANRTRVTRKEEHPHVDQWTCPEEVRRSADWLSLSPHYIHTVMVDGWQAHSESLCMEILMI